MDTHILGTQTVETDPNTSEERPALPLPQDLKTLLLLGIFILLFLYAIYFLGELIVPIIFAFMLSMALRPAVDFLTRLYIPKFAAGLVIVLMGATCLFGTAYLLSGPTSAWLVRVRRGARDHGAVPAATSPEPRTHGRAEAHDGGQGVVGPDHTLCLGVWAHGGLDSSRVRDAQVEVLA